LSFFYAREAPSIQLEMTGTQKGTTETSGKPRQRDQPARKKGQRKAPGVGRGGQAERATSVASPKGPPQSRVRSVSYPEHLSAEAAQAGVDHGTLFEAVIRYNANDNTQAFCCVDGIDTDIFIEGAVRQNRSVHGDLVVIRILGEEDWWSGGSNNNNNNKNGKSGTKGTDAKSKRQQRAGEITTNAAGLDLEEVTAGLSAVELNGTSIVERVSRALNTTRKGSRATGAVVFIKKVSERRFNLVGCLRDGATAGAGAGPAGKWAVFVPLDGRLPMGRVVDSEAIYCHERDASKAIASHYYEAKIVRWPASGSCTIPEVQLKSMLGKPGRLETDVQALLMAENVNDDDLFDEHILACLPATPWTIPADEYTLRRDLRDSRIFSIDPETAKDLDDALSIEALENGMYQVGVHIADVSYFVKPGTALDDAAQVRSTSVYLVDRVIPMLPRLLCEELCSLNPGTERLAMSIIWQMKADGEILDVWMGRTVINSCVKLSYQMAQTVIDAFEAGEPLPTETFMTASTGATTEVFGGHTRDEVANDVIKLHKIARSLRKKRYANGSLRLDNSKVGVRLVEGNVDDFGLYVTGSANHLVEEFMLAANISAAKKTSSAFPERALLRRHPEPNMNKLINTSDSLKQYLPDAPIINTGSAGTVQASLSQLKAFYRDRPEILEAITFMVTKPMQMAEYFNTNDLEQDLWRHYALAIPMYTHFTSPIRRYPDIIVHRLINNALMDAEPAPADVSEISQHANERKAAAKACQEKVTNLYLVKVRRSANSQRPISFAPFAPFALVLACLSLFWRPLTDDSCSRSAQGSCKVLCAAWEGHASSTYTFPHWDRISASSLKTYLPGLESSCRPSGTGSLGLSR
jgi:DIS3-like exonuclease 2